MIGPGHGAAVLRVKGSSKALVASTDGNQAVGVLDPWLGAALSVAEATRNVSITGATPLGVTNCLNYGDPTRPEAFWQLTEGVRGLGDACRALGLPVTGGNVSLYNESPAGAIAPTPEIGVVGRELWRQSGLSPADIQTAVLYDHFTPYVLMQLEELGFCGPGEAKDFIKNGNIELGGDLPINTHGGQLGEAYLHGMNGIAEAVRQVRGTSVNQIPRVENVIVTGGTGVPTSGLIVSADS